MKHTRAAIKVQLQAETSYDDVAKVFVSHCEALNIYSQGESEPEARKALEGAIRLYRTIGASRSRLRSSGVVGGLAYAKRWPNTGQWMHLFACVCSLSGAADVWRDGVLRVGSSASWGQVIGALCIVVITLKSAMSVVRELTARAPVPPPTEGLVGASAIESTVGEIPPKRDRPDGGV